LVRNKFFEKPRITILGSKGARVLREARSYFREVDESSRDSQKLGEGRGRGRGLGHEIGVGV